ncbi:MAG: 3-methyl-2-oxobutanoate hydroxymethyltransferase [Deltaproteobacteria bacterium]|nr:3-methyl-2-oxobutanoate hydroxymethyltransferase [Deltaproteobacteria bacterium]
MNENKITVPEIVARKARKEPITVLTAYDYQMASLLDGCGIEVLLTGDTLGNVVYGFDTTLPVTMELMIAHTAAVARGRKNALLVADMPFMSYATREDALKNAGRLVQEGMAEAVKLEGGVKVADRIKAVVDADIPLMGHVGLRPQAVNMMGGYKVQGREKSDLSTLLDDAGAVEEAGAFAVVIEGVPASVADEITKSLSIPTIGIGAGNQCDGQVLVINDMLGLSEFTPKFVRNFINLPDIIRNAVSDYSRCVKNRSFPSEEESYR